MRSASSLQSYFRRCAEQLLNSQIGCETLWVSKVDVPDMKREIRNSQNDWKASSFQSRSTNGEHNQSNHKINLTMKKNKNFIHQNKVVLCCVRWLPGSWQRCFYFHASHWPPQGATARLRGLVSDRAPPAMPLLCCSLGIEVWNARSMLDTQYMRNKA